MTVSKLTVLFPARRKPGVAKLKLVLAAKTRVKRKLTILRHRLVEQNQKQSWGIDIR
jgi:hypothetical protein